LRFTPGEVKIYLQAHSLIDTEIFLDWFPDTFIPDLVTRRERFGYQGSDFLIVSNWTAHHEHGFDTLCQAQTVVPAWLLLHSSNQLEKVKLQTSHIVSVLEGFLLADFRNAGVSLVMGADRMIRCAIKREKTRCIPGSPFQHGLMELAQEEET
jgi:hypothetical protein